MQVEVPTILNSKKFLAAAIASVLAYLCVREGFEWDKVMQITGPLYLYIGGQGLADIGKERAKVEANGHAAEKPPTHKI